MSIKEYIERYFQLKNEVNEMIQDVDNEILNESFQCSVLKEIDNYLHKVMKADKEAKKSEKYHYDRGRKFKSIFYYEWVNWAAIKDEDLKEYSKDDEEAIKLVKRMSSNRSNTFDGAIILISDDEKAETKYPGMLLKVGWQLCYYSLISSYGRRIGDRSSLRPSDALDYLTKKFYLIDLTNLTTRDIKRERDSAQSGMIYQGDENFYRKLAEQNLKRYKAYSAKMKAEKDANDDIPEKVQEYLNKVLKFVEKFSLEPGKYAQYEYDVKGLLELSSDKREYHSGHGSHKSYYSGVDGLLTVYAEYITSKLAQAKGNSYDWDRQKYEAAKKKLNELFVKIDKKIEELKTKAGIEDD